jgi:hypothetical protein
VVVGRRIVDSVVASPNNAQRKVERRRYVTVHDKEEKVKEWEARGQAILEKGSFKKIR